MITLVDLLIEKAKKEEKFFKNYLKYAKIIKRETEKEIGKVKGYVFGSVLKKREVPRDIDILLISPEFADSEKRAKVRLKVEKRLGDFCPFELHLITPEQYKNWYRYFLKKKIRI